MYIVRFLHQTTTRFKFPYFQIKLYIVRFLHQTTTIRQSEESIRKLYIVRFLHQTTTRSSTSTVSRCCISSVSYIKPQPILLFRRQVLVVYRPFPTSNHNFLVCEYGKHTSCISSVSYIKPQLMVQLLMLVCSCISSVSYIKPQLASCSTSSHMVVYRPFPTSNHNRGKY